MSRTDGAPALITVFMLMSVSAALKTTNNVSQDLFVTAPRAFRVQSKYLRLQDGNEATFPVGRQTTELVQTRVAMSDATSYSK